MLESHDTAWEVSGGGHKGRRITAPPRMVPTVLGTLLKLIVN